MADDPLRARLVARMMEMLQVPIAEPFARDDIRRAERLIDPLLPLVVAEVRSAAATARVETLHEAQRVIAESDILRTKAQIVEWLGHQRQGADGLAANPYRVEEAPPAGGGE